MADLKRDWLDYLDIIIKSLGSVVLRQTEPHLNGLYAIYGHSVKCSEKEHQKNRRTEFMIITFDV